VPARRAAAVRGAPRGQRGGGGGARPGRALPPRRPLPAGPAGELGEGPGWLTSWPCRRARPAMQKRPAHSLALASLPVAGPPVVRGQRSSRAPSGRSAGTRGSGIAAPPVVRSPSGTLSYGITWLQLHAGGRRAPTARGRRRACGRGGGACGAARDARKCSAAALRALRGVRDGRGRRLTPLPSRARGSRGCRGARWRAGAPPGGPQAYTHVLFAASLHAKRSGAQVPRCTPRPAGSHYTLCLLQLGGPPFHTGIVGLANAYTCAVARCLSPRPMCTCAAQCRARALPCRWQC